jgi:hypothetical protein
VVSEAVQQGPTAPNVLSAFAWWCVAPPAGFEPTAPGLGIALLAREKSCQFASFPLLGDVAVPETVPVRYAESFFTPCVRSDSATMS